MIDMRQSKTCCIMKGLFYCCIALIAVIATVTTCVFSVSKDAFSGTSWNSDEVPLGPLEVSELTMEFSEDGRVTVSLEWDNDEAVAEAPRTQEEVVLSGGYYADGGTAVLQGLLVTIRTLDVTFIEAHLSGETLFLLWRVENAVYPFTTALHRPG